MQSAEFLVGTCAFIRERAPEWHGRVREGCTTSCASCDNGLRSSVDASHRATTGQVRATMST